jgi:dTDP-4-amino-4,6-dideoxygalactose transaminase
MLVFADIDLETYTIAPEKVKRALTRRTKVVMPVHLYGYPADIDSIHEVLSSRRIFVVEDACQAHGATYKGRKTGNLGDVACFSFYPSKNMTVGGDGGMLTTNLERVAAKAAKLRNCGRKSKYVHDIVGYTARLNTVNAAIGRVQLKYLDRWNEKRVRNAETYDRLLSDIDELVLPPRGRGGIRPVYHLYTVRTRSRDKLAEWLGSNGIQCGVNYVLPIHLQPIYKKMFGFRRGMYPASEELCRTCLSIPMYPDLSLDEVHFVSETIHRFFEKN